MKQISSNRKIHGRAFTTVFALALLATACGVGDNSAVSDSTALGVTTTEESTASPSASQLPDTIKIAALSSETGPLAFCGKGEQEGYELAIKEATESGRFANTKFDLTVIDDASTAAGGIAAFTRALDVHPSAIIGVCYGVVWAPIDPKVDENKIPVIWSNVGAADAAKPEYAYRATLSQRSFAGHPAKILADRGIGSVGIVFTPESQTQVDLLAKVIKPALESAGIEILFEEGVKADLQDFSAQIAIVKDRDPDAVVVLNTVAQAISLVSQLRQAGIDSPIYGHSGLATSAYTEALGSDANGTITGTPFHRTFAFKSSVAFVELYRAQFGHDPDFTSAIGYDTMKILFAAIEAAGSAESEAIKVALDSLTSYDGAQGPLTFNADGETEGSGGVIEVVDGAYAFVK